MEYFSAGDFNRIKTSSNLMSYSRSIISANPTVLVIGGSYAGLRAAEVLAKELPQNWSVTLVERNSHFNHVYSFPRSAVTGQSHWNFIPYSGKINKLNQVTPSSILEKFNQDLSLSLSTNSTSSTSPDQSISNQRIQFINATVTKIEDGKVLLDRMVSLDNTPAPLYEPVHSLSSSSSSSIRSNSIDLSSTFVSDSGYGSSSSMRADKSIDFTHHQSEDYDNIEHLNYPSSSPPLPRTFHVEWDFLIYALGSHMPTPLQLPEGLPRTKQTGVQFLEAQQSAIANADKIVIVGGGALGIQYACDIAHRYQLSGHPKKVTLIHSRSTFLPTFKPEMDAKVKEALKSFDVEVVLGERVNLAKLKNDINDQKQKKIKSIMVESASIQKRQWDADLVFVCTGQVPNTNLMAKFCPLAVTGTMTNNGSTGLIKVNRALQISPSKFGPSPVETPTGELLTCDCAFSTLKTLNTPEKQSNPTWSRVFAIGDCVDGFGAIKAGHVGWNQAEIAAKNIVKLIQLSQLDECPVNRISGIDVSQLEPYVPSPPMMKLTLGLNRVISQLTKPDNPNEVEVTEKIIPFSSLDTSVPRSMWNRYDIPEQDMLDGWL